MGPTADFDGAAIPPPIFSMLRPDTRSSASPERGQRALKKQIILASLCPLLTWNMLVHAVKLLFVDAQLTVAGLLIVLGQPPSFV